MTKAMQKDITKNITTFTTEDYIGILLLNEEDLNAISKQSGTLANTNEYQVHYWYLVLRKQFEDSSILDVAIPTVFFNYKQEVSPAHISFELEDVEKVSKQLAPFHNEVLLDITPKVKEFKTKFGFEVMTVNLGTLHKHPSSW